ncbi:Endoribonuclease YbeY [Sporotomaculum syntrophicum]|uniref:Endoribonuclease YbeY n=1 Tax=Sporotomaculum syntrophicum TaxID=182264 RepID=A0A9D2WNN8_9FIRM|nr:rRNA maturation RNase YbeY [Sporotomaculum syntrophicum]KAF1084076.1 Endoribonuclease YbeY [Sporotomaculum syntrophicum]
MPVLVSNLQEKVPVESKLEEMLIRVVEKALGEHDIPENAEVSLVFVDDAYMSLLNQQYRGIDGPTDVLSFAMQEGPDMPGFEEEQLLGDVVVSMETAQRQAEEYGHSFNREVAYLTVHGVLHLLGYDHQTLTDKQKMREQEENILTRACLSASLIREN